MVQPYTTINHGDIFPLPLFLMVKSLFFMVKFMFLTGTSFSFNVSISRFSMDTDLGQADKPQVQDWLGPEPEIFRHKTHHLLKWI